MSISSLRITNFRNLAAIDLTPSAGLNIICGLNGSGKTSLLEAIHYLSSGRSFRHLTSTPLVRFTTDNFSIHSQLHSETDCAISIGLQRHSNGTMRLRVAELEASSITQLASYLPLRVIHSQSHQLFEAGPAYRRKYLDWGLFYQSTPFLACWRHFEHVLKQRNAILREHRSQHELTIWTNELVRYAVALDQLRRDYAALLAPYIMELTNELSDIQDLAIAYYPGWDENQDYAAVLNCRYEEDYQLGYTQLGPHRADLTINVSGLPAKHFLSRGQQKLLICAMIIAQGKCLFHGANRRLIYLIDDLPAELDKLNRQKLLSLLSQQQTQVFITAVENDTLYGVISDKLQVPMKVFHVEHGHIAQTA